MVHGRDQQPHLPRRRRGAFARATPAIPSGSSSARAATSPSSADPACCSGRRHSPSCTRPSQRLDPGDGIVFYTDGVTDARSPDGFYGEKRLRATLEQHRGSAHGLVYPLLDDVVAFQAGTTDDDIVIVGLHVPA